MDLRVYRPRVSSVDPGGGNFKPPRALHGFRRGRREAPVLAGLPRSVTAEAEDHWKHGLNFHGTGCYLHGRSHPAATGQCVGPNAAGSNDPGRRTYARVQSGSVQLRPDARVRGRHRLVSPGISYLCHPTMLLRWVIAGGPALLDRAPPLEGRPRTPHRRTSRPSVPASVRTGVRCVEHDDRIGALGACWPGSRRRSDASFCTGITNVIASSVPRIGDLAPRLRRRIGRSDGSEPLPEPPERAGCVRCSKATHDPLPFVVGRECFAPATLSGEGRRFGRAHERRKALPGRDLGDATPGCTETRQRLGRINRERDRAVRRSFRRAFGARVLTRP